MNAETAEALMRRYRPGKECDSRAQKAAKFAEQDPTLQKKLQEQIAFDQQIIDVIHYIKPPDNLRKKLTDLSAQPGAEKKTGLRKHVINPAVLTAILGGLLLLGVVGFLVMERMEKFDGRERVEGLLGAASKMSGAEFENLTTTTDDLGDWLFMREFEGYETPPGLKPLPVVGSRVFYYDSTKIAQAAIDRNQSLFYQFQASKLGVNLPAEGEWVYLTKDRWVGAITKRGDRCFMFAFRGSKEEMREFIKTLPKK